MLYGNKGKKTRPVSPVQRVGRLFVVVVEQDKDKVFRIVYNDWNLARYFARIEGKTKVASSVREVA